jgi:hypothetical protein
VNETWWALAHEAGIAAEHLAIGATALGKVNYAQPAYYGQAFFALSIGLERATKLALVVDHALEHGGTSPSHGVLRDYGHKLEKLLAQTDEIAKRRGRTATEDLLPRTVIHEGIIKVLSDFASNVTRYYNLDLVTGDPRTERHDDPICAWYELVVTPILTAHYDPRQRDEHERNARQIAKLSGGFVSVFYYSECGDVLDEVFDAFMHDVSTEFARPYARMYVMQIARFLARLLSDLGDNAAYGSLSDTVPVLSEFFATFNNGDGRLWEREAWSIYPGG